MDLLQLHYFKKVAELEHMTLAAEALKIAQPSLSKSISRLEEDLGVKLFERYNRQIKLNENGRLFLRRVDAVLFELQEARRELDESSRSTEQSIRLSVTIPRVLPDLISGFLKEQPATYFKQYVQAVPAMTAMLREGKVDFCISPASIEEEDIVWEPLMTEEILLIVPPGHWLENHSTIALHQLKQEAFVSMNEGYGLRNLTDKYCEAAGFTPHIAFEGDEPGVIGDLVKNGLGIAFIPATSISGARTTTLHVCRIHHPVCERTIGLAYSKRRFMTASARKFRSYSLQYFREFGEKLEKIVSKVT